jgi:hypothetical protein
MKNRFKRKTIDLFSLKLLTSFLPFEPLAAGFLDVAAAAAVPDSPSLPESELSINSFDLGIVLNNQIV